MFFILLYGTILYLIGYWRGSSVVMILNESGWTVIDPGQAKWYYSDKKDDYR